MSKSRLLRCRKKGLVGTRKTYKLLKKRYGKKWCHVYALRDPQDFRIYYVGQTRTSLERRVNFHLKRLKIDMRTGATLSPAQRWLKALYEQGLRPQPEMLEFKAEWDVTEVVFIDRLRAQGEPLLNVAGVVRKFTRASTVPSSLAKSPVANLIEVLRAGTDDPGVLLRLSADVITRLRERVIYLGDRADICVYDDLNEVCPFCACPRRVMVMSSSEWAETSHIL